MTQDEVIRLAIQCNLVTTGNRDGLYMDALTEFANLVTTKEREACAKMCEQMDSINDYYGERIELICAEAIRARGEQA